MANKQDGTNQQDNYLKYKQRIIPLTPTRMAIIKKKKRKITSIGEDIEKLQPSCTASGNVK